VCLTASRREWLIWGRWGSGARFSLVDAVFGPVFRHFDAFDRIGDFGILSGLPTVAAWRQALASCATVQAAVAPHARLAPVAADGDAARRRIGLLFV